MPKDFYDFVFWLDFQHDSITNREVIYNYYDILCSTLKENKIKVTTENFKNQFIAYIYEHSNSSGIKKGINNKNGEPPPDIFFYKYEPIINEYFEFIKEDTVFNAFNILDSNERFQRINLLDLIENNIEIEDDILDEDEEFSEDSDYESYEKNDKKYYRIL